MKHRLPGIALVLSGLLIGGCSNSGLGPLDSMLKRAPSERAAPRTPQNESPEARGFRILAEAGDPDGQFRLASLYFYGQTVHGDDAQASYWFEQAARQGQTEAQYYFGEMHYQGRGTARDYAKAAEWYRRAAEGGYALAQANLATMTYDGQGVSRDPVEAYKWITLGVAHATTDEVRKFATGAREVMTRALSGPQIGAGESRAREWTAARQITEDAVRESALRWISARWGGSSWLIEVERGAPSPGLMERFQADPRFRSVAELELSPPQGLGGLRYVLNGVVISVGSLTWRNRNEATATVSAYRGPLEATSGRVVIERNFVRRWICREVEGTWSIS